MKLLLLIVFLATAVTLPARAERLVTSISNQDVEVSSSFAGEKISFFGNIEASAGGPPARGPYQVIMVIEGPLLSRVARQQSNRFGIWSNTDQVIFRNFPSYYHVLASDRLNDIESDVLLNEKKILPEDQARFTAEADWWKATEIGRELVYGEASEAILADAEASLVEEAMG